MKRNITSIYFLPGLVFIFSLVVSHFAWNASLTSHYKFVQAQFVRHLTEYALLLQKELDANLEAVLDLKSFYYASENFDHESFQKFSHDILSRRKSIQALEWVPRVSTEERINYEKNMIQRGFPHFRISELDIGRVQTPAKQRSLYFPVSFVSPMKGNEITHGLDRASDPIIEKAISLAGDTGKFTTTDKVILMQEKAESFAFLALLPVYKKGMRTITNHNRKIALRGFLAGVYRIESLFRETLIDFQKFGNELYLFDVSNANGSPVFLGYYGSQKLGAMDYTNLPQGSGEINAFKADLHVPGRIWKMVVYPNPDFIESYPAKFSYAVIVAGLLISVMLAFVTLLYLISYNKTKSITEANDNLGRSNANLERANEELEKANEDMESFSYSVSHDLRAPLRHMHGFINLLMKSVDALDDKQQRYVRIIAESSQRMGYLIDDLLHFSRTGRTEMNEKDFDLKVLVDGIQRELIAQTKGRNIEWHIDDLPHVYGDPDLIRMVFTNLLSNAVKYTAPKNPSIIKINYESNGTDNVTVKVSDNGVGFENEYVDKLFGVFQRLHRADEFEGTGIGLATVKRIIQRHGGQVWADGEVDRGASFYCTLSTKESTT